MSILRQTCDNLMINRKIFCKPGPRLTSRPTSWPWDRRAQTFGLNTETEIETRSSRPLQDHNCGVETRLASRTQRSLAAGVDLITSIIVTSPADWQLGSSRRRRRRGSRKPFAATLLMQQDAALALIGIGRNPANVKNARFDVDLERRPPVWSFASRVHYVA